MRLSGIGNWRQRREGDCLPACVAMVLTHLGEPVDWEGLRRRLGTTEPGTPFSQVKRLRSRVPWARLHVECEQGNLDTLRQRLLAGEPVIVGVAAEFLPHWLLRPEPDVTQRKIDHAVVVIGLDEQQVFVNDPDFAEAPQAVEIGWFVEAWQGQSNQYAVIRRRSGSRWARLWRGGR